MDGKSNRNYSDGDSSESSEIKLPKWVTKKTIVSFAEYLTIATLKQNKNNSTWCISCNNGNGVWGYNLKVFHKEWKVNQDKKKLVWFSDYVTNAVIYCSYIMATSK